MVLVKFVNVFAQTKPLCGLAPSESGIAKFSFHSFVPVGPRESSFSPSDTEARIVQPDLASHTLCHYPQGCHPQSRDCHFFLPFLAASRTTKPMVLSFTSRSSSFLSENTSSMAALLWLASAPTTCSSCSYADHPPASWSWM